MHPELGTMPLQRTGLHHIDSQEASAGPHDLWNKEVNVGCEHIWVCAIYLSWEQILLSKNQVSGTTQQQGVEPSS